MSAPTPTEAPPPHPVLTRPEILSPAGDWDCVRAAVENGADAVYFGLERFNARMRAKNFTVADLPKLMEFLHRRGVRGYVTFNVLVFADELSAAEDYLRAIIASGVDAAIVQDIGICRLIRAISPDFPIHTSTQMTVTSAAGVEFARDLGANLVVLARENSLKDITAIREAQQSAAGPLPLEVFVHGALCVAYSGQCLTSESLGGRSANRGECAQACRMPYELVSDGAPVDLGDRRYLLSPQDLSGLEVLPELIRAGVASLKIEGRLKSPEYVANITRVYRRALDTAMAEFASGQLSSVAPAPTARGEAAPAPFDPQSARYDLEMGFSRGLYTGWFRGINNQELAHARFGTKRGVFLGTVTRVGRDHVALTLVAPLKPGDGLVFDAGRPDEKEEGGRVYQVETRGGETVLRFGQGDLDFSRIQPGQLLWKTNDPELDRRVRQSYEGDQIRFRRPLHLEVHGHAGAPLTLIARTEEGHVARMDTTSTLVVAQKQPLSTERLRDQLGRLGGTPFVLGELDNQLEGDVIVAVSELNDVRRRLITAVDTLRAAPQRWTMNPATLGPVAASLLATDAAVPGPVAPAPDAPPELIVVIRHLHQLEAAWATGARTIYCEFEDPKKYREAVTRFRELRGNDPAASLWVIPPRVFKPGEEWILRQVLSSEADGYLVRNYDHLPWFAAHRRRGDFSLNVANPLTAGHFINHHGLERVTASYDLNVAQLEALLQGAPAAWFDITLHQHMPMFHMEHCVFCAFLSTGTDYRNCGRPCDRHDVRLRDRVGAEHPLKADAGCRNTVYNSRAQTGAEFADRLLALGARSFRIEFLNESADELQRTVSRYRQLLRGELSGGELWREFKLINQLGVTRGQLESAPPLMRRKP
ncbi:putative protease YhbU precursor [Lacunisphaera limnophila]|uniref:Putative protease YhbU n=1 Tax=Lacunisphaera limnophila TaxID=1838286 RepID=A0A1D8AVV8_9BACT|nr:U32 family peptidase [Lacunisphaera limnophila]AOS45038.1 putative protease YhbU precursor [Lacunisphaera limnophila]